MVTDVGILMTAFMSPLKFEERTGTLVTVLLALFAFLNFARSMLPDVPVATWLDKQIFRSVAMSLIGMLETLLSKYEYVGFNLVDPSTLMQHDRYHPSQWDYDQPLSETQSISRIARCLLLATELLLMLLTMGEILFALRAYRNTLAASSRCQHSEMKKRSTDFDVSAYGWPMSIKAANEVAMPAITRPRRGRKRSNSSAGDQGRPSNRASNAEVEPFSA